VSIASKVGTFLIKPAQVAGKGWSWVSGARLKGKKWPASWSASLIFYRIGGWNPIAGVNGSVKGKQPSMLNKLNPAQRRHLAAVKSLPCGVCGVAGPSDAHHIEQGLQYTCIPLCKDCHQGSHNGIHGQRRIWNVLKKSELSVLNETIEKLLK